MRTMSFCLLILCIAGSSFAADNKAFLLEANLTDGDQSEVQVTLEVGGEMIMNEEDGEKRYPLSVEGELKYQEQLVTSSSEPNEPVRALRNYRTATAKIQVEDAGLLRELPQSKRQIVAEIRDGHTTLIGNESPLSRDEFDLINVIGNTLAINRLLPNREVSEGENWNHDSSSIGALLGMDHVAVCEVHSVVTGIQHQQVKVRLAGTVHGTVDGAPSEMELRAAYLYHQRQKRITKLNLAIKEKRTTSSVVPGLDVVAKVSVVVTPSPKKPLLGFSELAQDVSKPLEEVLVYDSNKDGYRFQHDRGWYITDEQRERVSLRFLQDGNLTAHCNITTLSPRSAGRETTLEQFEADVRSTLSDYLESVSASTQWKTAQGHDCLGVVAIGKVKDVPIEWRYYLIASPDKPQISVAVTIEQSSVETFNDADRQIVDSLQLLAKPKTASRSKAKRSR